MTHGAGGGGHDDTSSGNRTTSRDEEDVVTEGAMPSGATAIEWAPDAYALKDLERRICEDERVTELGVRLSVRGGRVVVHGNLMSEARRDEVVSLVREHCPACDVVDETSCAEAELSTPPVRAEELR